MIGVIGQLHLHLMINSAVGLTALFLFKNIRQSLRRGLAFIAPFGFLGVFGNVSGLARQKSAGDAASRAVVAPTAAQKMRDAQMSLGDLENLAAEASESIDPQTEKTGKKLTKALVNMRAQGGTDISLTQGQITDVFNLITSKDDNISLQAQELMGFDLNVLQELTKDAQTGSSTDVLAGRTLEKLLDGKEVSAFEKGKIYFALGEKLEAQKSVKGEPKVKDTETPTAETLSKKNDVEAVNISEPQTADLTELVNEKNKKILPKKEDLKEKGENAEKNNPEAEKTFEDTRPEEQRKRSEAAKDFGKVKKTVAGDGYILYDGTNVDMTKKVYHHRQMILEDIAAIYENGGTSEDFVSEGNIKKEGNTLTIKTAPTAAQTAQIENFVKINKGDVKLNINGDIRFDLKGVNGEYVTALLAGIYDESGRNVVFSGNMINIKGKPTAGDYKAIEYYVNEQRGDFGIIAQTQEGKTVKSTFKNADFKTDVKPLLRGIYSETSSDVSKTQQETENAAKTQQETENAAKTQQEETEKTSETKADVKITAEDVIYANNLYPGEIRYAVDMVLGDAQDKNMPKIYNKSGVKQLVEYLSQNLY